MNKLIIEYYRALCTFVTTDETSEREKLRSTLTEMAEKANASWKLSTGNLGSLLVSVGQNISEDDTFDENLVTQRDLFVYRVKELADASAVDLLAIHDHGEAANVLAELKRAIFKG